MPCAGIGVDKYHKRYTVPDIYSISSINDHIKSPDTDHSNAVIACGHKPEENNILSPLISTAYQASSTLNIFVSRLLSGSVSYVVVSTVATIS